MKNIKSKIAIVLLLVLSIATGYGQSKKKTIYLIDETANIKKFHSYNDLKGLQKGDLLTLYKERITVSLYIMPFLALGSKPGTSLTALGIPETSDNTSQILKEAKNRDEFNKSIDETLNKFIPYADKENMIWAILFYEDLIKNFILVFTFVFYNVNAQQSFFQNVKYNGAFAQVDWTRMWSNFKPTSRDYASTNIILSGQINKNTILLKRNVYLLDGPVYVTQNASLTIEAGTVIRGDKNSVGTLIITKGSKIIANGTETDPIVFTSNQGIGDRKAGDWGGIIILGNAQINNLGGENVFEGDFLPTLMKYGGMNDDDNSGSLRFVRIEFPGHKINKAKELNGLSLAAVGKATTIENVQVSYSNDDSFELYGGAVNMKNIISYRCTDDDFDFTMGYNGQVQFALALRHPFISDFSGSRCIEIDSYSDISKNDPSKRATKCAIFNATLLTLVSDESQKSYLSDAVYVGNTAKINLSYSLFSAFSKAIVFEKEAETPERIENKELVFTQNVFNNVESAYGVVQQAKKYDQWEKPENGNLRNNTSQTEIFKDAYNISEPSFLPKNLQTSGIRR